VVCPGLHSVCLRFTVASRTGRHLVPSCPPAGALPAGFGRSCRSPDAKKPLPWGSGSSTSGLCQRPSTASGPPPACAAWGSRRSVPLPWRHATDRGSSLRVDREEGGGSSWSYQYTTVECGPVTDRGHVSESSFSRDIPGWDPALTPSSSG
jgi:hypothetical protein